MTDAATGEEAPIRPVTRADLLGICRIEKRTFEHPWRLETFEEYLDAAAFLVLEDPDATSVGEEVAGYVVATVIALRGQKIGHVKDLAVKPERQDAGRGRRLISAALRRLADHGATQARLEVRPSNEPAVALYESAGFAVIDREEVYYEDGEDALVMARKLPDRRDPTAGKRV